MLISGKALFTTLRKMDRIVYTDYMLLKFSLKLGKFIETGCASGNSFLSLVVHRAALNSLECPPATPSDLPLLPLSSLGF